MPARMGDRGWIIDSLGAPAFERLASELPGSQLQSVLLEVLRRRAKARAPAEVLAQYRRDSFCKPADGDAPQTGAQLIALRFRVQDQSLIEASP